MPTRDASPLIDPGPIEFEAVLERDEESGASGWVRIPMDLKSTYGKGTLVPVVATFDRTIEYRGSLAKMGFADAVIGLRKQFLEQLGKGVGDTIHVRLVLDTAPRVVILPEDVKARLENLTAAAAFWQALSYTHQKEYAQWIDAAKKPETREARVVKTLELLEGRRKSR